jgi:hypothetical protein
MSEEVTLPIPGSASVQGPKLSYEADKLVVTYDYQQLDGTVVWAKLTFSDVLAVDYRSSVCCNADQVISGNHVLKSSDLPLVEEVRRRWMSAVGWQQHQQDQGGSSRFFQYRMYFDDAACIDVVAGGMRIE